MSLFTLRSEQIKNLVEMGNLPFAAKTIPHHDLDDNQKKTVDDSMPLIHGFEASGGGYCNFNHLQNFLAYI
eukprot:14444800-Ditylum_brightwellii.AAC.1